LKGAGSRAGEGRSEQRAERRKKGKGSREQEARNREQGKGSREQGEALE
jgi:hypothetical protein